jgi:signal transduction histidine kinase
VSLPEPSSTRQSPQSRRDFVLLALASLLVATLVGSVVIPALETRRIMGLLRDITTTIEPARVRSWQLESGLTLEFSALQGYAFSGDSALLQHYQSVAADNSRQLASIEQLAPQLGPAAVRSVAEVRSRVERWRELNHVLLRDGMSHEQRALVVRGQRALRDSIIDAVDQLPVALSTQIVLQREEIAAHERQGLLVNAALVLSALAGIGIAIVVSLRQRRLAAENVMLLEKARDARRELERVMASRERLIRGFSHDLKNPLGAADGYADLVVNGIFGEVNDAQRHGIESLRRSIHHALGLIDDLHELARTETGVLALRRESVHIGELVHSLYEEYRGAAHASGLALGVDATNELPVVVTDGGRLRQIIGNLLSNAIKYTRAGSVTLRARSQGCDAGSNGGGWVFVDVIDTGIGIPADKRELIFEEFSRLDSSEKPGAGLGLAISERLAEALGGRILVESEVGAGSTFTVQLPIA